jgi:hypothetical protein
MSATAPARWQILECLGLVAEPLGTTVHVKAPGQIFGLSLERALYRIEEFKESDQGIVLTMLPLIYAIPTVSVMCMTDLERRLIKYFRAMKPSAQHMTVDAAEDVAEALPAASGIEHQQATIL